MALSSQRIEGLDRLQKKLKALPQAVKDRIKQAMAEVANDIVNMAKGLVPTDSGELRNSINWTYGDAPKGSISLATVAGLGGAKELTITIYAGNDQAFYAKWVEFGVAAHTAGGKFAGAQIPAIPASPFFYVSYRANRRRGKAKISRAINKAAKDVAAGKL